ncbi:GRAS family transcription factor [Striga asiatica]|uniref:GRAS family transcription factor n=1 Tax=Striga asiatica TaxID=4170 RepID=A0A5A7RJA9_STRAF|nr:GRAS family transcription factor [Striga asiatica]
MDPFRMENRPTVGFSHLDIRSQELVEADIPSFREQRIGKAHFIHDQPIQNANEYDNITGNCDLSSGILSHIDHILMEEDFDESACMLQEESLDFQAKFTSFYEVLGQKYPPYSPQNESPSHVQSIESAHNYNHSCVDHPNLMTSNNHLVDPNQDSHNLPNYDNYLTSDILSDSSSGVVWDFGRGVSWSHPIGSEVLDYADRVFSLEIRNSCGEKKMKNKNVNVKSLYFETRDMQKFSAVSDITEELSNVSQYILDGSEELLAAYMADLKFSESNKSVDSINNDQANNEAPSGESKLKKRSKKKKDDEVVDLTSLLINCADFIADGGHEAARNLLKQIKLHSSPYGNPSQRLAHYFSDGLEARLAGPSSERFKSLERMPEPSDDLKAHCMSVVFTPFMRFTRFACDKMILMKSSKATRLHIVDFGFSTGFQWPDFIRRLAKRRSGPPSLKITGIDFPLEGPRPAERVEEMGLRLARFAEKYGVPFECITVAEKWEDVTLEKLKIENGDEFDFVVVNFSDGAKNVPDETVNTERSRDTVLNLIRKVKPDVIVHGVVNGAFNKPFFVHRFREALSHYSAMFDIMEAMMGRDKPERMLVERDVFGKAAFNVIACEGLGRVERPETYRQWHVRNVRAGFVGIPFERKLMDDITREVRNFYHKEFVIYEDHHWLLMSWKGRVFYAISLWKPANSWEEGKIGILIARGAPFFVTGFREALFSYSSIFDMLETSIPPENPDAVSKMRRYYHREFVVDEDNRWLLMGWKGRILYALSCWKPA